MDIVKGLKVIASKPRLRVLHLLKNPVDNFPAQPVGDPKTDGVTSAALMKKLGCTQPTLSEHMDALMAVGFVESKKLSRFVLYKRDEDRIEQFLREFRGIL
jgi:DNA-binding transcriptional ArsR family regulator